MHKNKRIISIISIVILSMICFFYCTVVVNKSIGGDDQQNYLTFYNAVRNKTYLGSVIDWFAYIIPKLNPFSCKRYFPLAGGSFLERKIFYSSVVMYRIWILLYTILDILLVALLMLRLTKNKYSIYIIMILSTVSLNMWRMSDGNTLTTYEALVQRTLMWELFALHLYLSWFITNNKRYAILGTICTFLGCLTYEIGYFTVFYMMVIALFENLKSLGQYIKRIIPVTVGTFISMILYIIASKNGTPSSDVTVSIAPNAIFMTLVKQIAASFPLTGIIHGNEMVDFSSFNILDYVTPFLLALIVAVCIYKIDNYLYLKDYIKYILLGILLLVLPSLLISITAKFQDSVYSDWTTGWIVTFVGSLGIAIISYTIMMGVLYFIKIVYANNYVAKLLFVIFIFFSTFFVGTYSRFATEQNINNSYNANHYNIKADALENGLMSYTDNVELLISNEHIWGDSHYAVKEFFNRFDTYSDFDVVFPFEYDSDQFMDGSTYYYSNLYNECRCIPLIGKVDNKDAETINEVYIYIDKDNIDEKVCIEYEYYDDNGDIKTANKVPIQIDNNKLSNGDKGYFVELEDRNIISNSLRLVVCEAENEEN